MSILINMEMPKEQITAVINPDGLVEILSLDNVLLDEFYAVEVKPHGRLIDADAELKKLNRICLPDDLSYTIGHDIAKQFLRDATTIIPADEPFGKSEQLNL